jgi:LAS superfamily LD-carboxypeptidase LdcB
LFYQKTGQSLSINSAYRTLDHQKKMDAKDKNNQVATPWYSGHNAGYSIDIHNGDRYATALWGIQWFQELAKKCNFTPLKGEDWHFDHRSLPKAEDRLEIAQALDKEYREKIVNSV